MRRTLLWRCGVLESTAFVVEALRGTPIQARLRPGDVGAVSMEQLPVPRTRAEAEEGRRQMEAAFSHVRLPLRAVRADTSSQVSRRAREAATLLLDETDQPDQPRRASAEAELPHLIAAEARAQPQRQRRNHKAGARAPGARLEELSWRYREKPTFWRRVVSQAARLSDAGFLKVLHAAAKLQDPVLVLLLMKRWFAAVTSGAARWPSAHDLATSPLIGLLLAHGAVYDRHLFGDVQAHLRSLTDTVVLRTYGRCDFGAWVAAVGLCEAVAAGAQVEWFDADRGEPLQSPAVRGAVVARLRHLCSADPTFIGDVPAVVAAVAPCVALAPPPGHSPLYGSRAAVWGPLWSRVFSGAHRATRQSAAEATQRRARRRLRSGVGGSAGDHTLSFGDRRRAARAASEEQATRRSEAAALVHEVGPRYGISAADAPALSLYGHCFLLGVALLDAAVARPGPHNASVRDACAALALSVFQAYCCACPAVFPPMEDVNSPHKPHFGALLLLLEAAALTGDVTAIAAITADAAPAVRSAWIPRLLRSAGVGLVRAGDPSAAHAPLPTSRLDSLCGGLATLETPWLERPPMRPSDTLCRQWRVELLLAGPVAAADLSGLTPDLLRQWAAGDTVPPPGSPAAHFAAHGVVSAGWRPDRVAAGYLAWAAQTAEALQGSRSSATGDALEALALVADAVLTARTAAGLALSPRMVGCAVATFAHASDIPRVLALLQGRAQGRGGLVGSLRRLGNVAVLGLVVLCRHSGLTAASGAGAHPLGPVAAALGPVLRSERYGVLGGVDARVRAFLTSEASMAAAGSPRVLLPSAMALFPARDGPRAPPPLNVAAVVATQDALWRPDHSTRRLARAGSSPRHHLTAARHLQRSAFQPQMDAMSTQGSLDYDNLL